MDYIDKIRTQIKWLINQILCMNFTAGNADSPDGSNGSVMVTEKVKWISAYDAHLEFIDSPEAISGIKGHTVLKIKDELIALLTNPVSQTELVTGNTDEIDASNGTTIISTSVDTISAYNEHLEFVPSVNLNGTVLKIKQELLDSLIPIPIPIVSIKTGNTESEDGTNGSTTISDPVTYISAFSDHLEFVDSPIGVSGIPNNTVLKLTDDFLSTLTTNVSSTFNFDVNSLQLDLGWKNGGRYETKIINENTVGIKDKAYTRNAFIANESNVPITHLEVLEVNNLIVKIPDFSKIAAYNPRLLIYRYKPSKKKGLSVLYPLKPVRSTAGFKLYYNTSTRPNLIPLNAGYQLLDIGQEDYFSISGYDGLNYNTITAIKPKGVGKRNSNKYLKGAISYYNAWVYLEFGIKITKDGIDYIVKPLNKIKMILSVKVNQTTNTLVSSKIKFKFT